MSNFKPVFNSEKTYWVTASILGNGYIDVNVYIQIGEEKILTSKARIAKKECISIGDALGLEADSYNAKDLITDDLGPALKITF